MSPYACAVLGAVAGIGGALVALASRYLPRPAAEPEPDPPDQAVYLACHTTACAHLARPHARTPVGLVCRACGHTVEATDA